LIAKDDPSVRSTLKNDEQSGGTIMLKTSHLARTFAVAGLLAATAIQAALPSPPSPTSPSLPSGFDGVEVGAAAAAALELHQPP
jgi:hypothetical protein